MARPADPRRRDAILDAARYTFERDGFSESKMTDIARRARMAVGTLYLYFDSKDAIARALAGLTFERAAAVILKTLEKPLTRRRLATMVRQTFDAVFESPTVGRHGIPMSDIAPSLVADSWGRVVTELAWALERQMDLGHVRRCDPMTLADYMSIVVRRAVLVSAKQDRKREPYQATLTEFLAGALLVTPAA